MDSTQTDYRHGVLVGNWNEDRFGVQLLDRLQTADNAGSLVCNVECCAIDVECAVLFDAHDKRRVVFSICECTCMDQIWTH